MLEGKAYQTIHIEFYSFVHLWPKATRCTADGVQTKGTGLYFELLN